MSLHELWAIMHEPQGTGRGTKSSRWPLLRSASCIPCPELPSGLLGQFCSSGGGQKSVVGSAVSRVGGGYHGDSVPVVHVATKHIVCVCVVYAICI